MKDNDIFHGDKQKLIDEGIADADAGRLKPLGDVKARHAIARPIRFTDLPVTQADFDRVTAERDAALEEVEALKHWRDLALQFDSHRLKALWHLKTLVSDGAHYDAAAAFLAEPPTPASELQRRLTAADERADVLETALAGMLFAFDDGVGLEWSEDLLDFSRKLTAAKEFKAALKPAEGGGDAVGRVSLSDKALSLIDEEIRKGGMPT